MAIPQVRRVLPIQEAADGACKQARLRGAGRL